MDMGLAVELTAPEGVSRVSKPVWSGSSACLPASAAAVAAAAAALLRVGLTNRVGRVGERACA
jgi:hypothetical protein